MLAPTIFLKILTLQSITYQNGNVILNAESFAIKEEEEEDRNVCYSGARLASVCVCVMCLLMFSPHTIVFQLVTQAEDIIRPTSH